MHVMQAGRQAGKDVCMHAPLEGGHAGERGLLEVGPVAALVRKRGDRLGGGAVILCIQGWVGGVELNRSIDKI